MIKCLIQNIPFNLPFPKLFFDILLNENILSDDLNYLIKLTKQIDSQFIKSLLYYKSLDDKYSFWWF
jgi:hypothetical protein